MATYSNKPVKTATINYTDPAPGAVPQLQILNDVAGNVGEVQFKGKSGNFAATNNLAWDNNSQTLNIRGNVRMTGTIVGNLIGNPSYLKLIGGNAGDLLTTDGTGNVSWQPLGNVTYGNSEVANYLPTFTGNIKAGNADLGDVAVANYFSGNFVGNIAVANYFSGNVLSNVVIANYIVGNLLGQSNSSITSDNANTANFAETANTANIANSVDIGNIVGMGNIAVINLDGNSANLLTGDGQFSSIPIVDPSTVVWTYPPDSNSAPGLPGQAAYDEGGNLYVCVATDTWAKFTGSISW